MTKKKNVVLPNLTNLKLLRLTENPIFQIVLITEGGLQYE